MLLIQTKICIQLELDGSMHMYQISQFLQNIGVIKLMLNPYDLFQSKHLIVRINFSAQQHEQVCVITKTKRDEIFTLVSRQKIKMP